MTIEEIAIKLQEVSDRSLRNEGRIKKLEHENNAIHQLATSSAVMAEQMKTMNGSISKLAGEVEEIKQKPAKLWETLISVSISAVVGIIIGALAVKLGL